MKTLLTALALVFLLEGAICALFPEAMRRMMMQVLAFPTDTLRRMGFIMAITGLLIAFALNRFL